MRQWLDKGIFDKSFVTNAFAALLVVISFSFLKAPYQHFVTNIGIFALSGALTNWLAIYMLFEKIPFLYGSGVIPLKFESFKSGLRALIMKEFFTSDNMAEVVSGDHWENAQWQALADLIEYENIVDALIDEVFSSSWGKTLSLFGGSEIAKQLKAPLEEKMHAAVSQLLADPTLQAKLIDSLKGGQQPGQLAQTIEKIVENRLAKLTPDKVKEIIQNMIREHLGWLVVWGGVFGGLIGLTASLLEAM